jgi:DNA end-binding protein Ku
MDALRQSIGQASPFPDKPARKSRKASTGQKEMLMPFQGKKAAGKGTGAKKPTSRPQRRSA